ncbi:FG-GAP repeat domain-containing protein [Legionella beliardensis]|nr:VCBS repeat-containing protein [Legionella beliardensis]
MIKIIIALIIISLEAFLLRKFIRTKNEQHSYSVPLKAPSANNSNYQINKPTLPFIGSAIFDLKGQGDTYLFIGGKPNQMDRVFLFQGENFLEVTHELTFSKLAEDATYCAMAIDANGDGLDDLFLARHSGLYFYENQQGQFTMQKLNIPIDKDFIPIAIALADLRKSVVDLIITYVKPTYFKKPNAFNQNAHSAKRFLLKNNGDNTFAVAKEF